MNEHSTWALLRGETHLSGADLGRAHFWLGDGYHRMLDDFDRRHARDAAWLLGIAH